MIEILYGLLIGFVVGLLVEHRNFKTNLLHKADTGVRLEIDGNLYVIQEVLE